MCDIWGSRQSETRSCCYCRKSQTENIEVRKLLTPRSEQNSREAEQAPKDDGVQRSALILQDIPPDILLRHPLNNFHPVDKPVAALEY
jgi:hypothetical protein